MFFFALLALVMLAGCNSSSEKVQVPKMYYGGADTTITDSCQSFILKDWSGKNSCGKYVSGKHWTPNGVEVKTHTITKQGTEASVENVRKILNPAALGHNSHQSVSSDWLSDLFRILLALLAVALLVWFIWWLFSQKPNSKSGTSSITESKTEPEKALPLASATTASESKKTFVLQSEEPSFPKGMNLPEVTAFLKSMNESGASEVKLPGGYKFKIPKNNGMRINVKADGDIKDTTIKVNAKQTITGYDDKK